MVKKIWQIQKELEYAQAREAYYSNPNRPVKTTVDPQPRTLAVYRSVFQRAGGAAVDYRVNLSQAALTFFGGPEAGALAALGLLAITASPEAIPKSGGFKPSLIKAMVGDATPTSHRAFGGTGRRVIDYSANTTGTAQAHYQAPIAGGDTTPTWDETVTKFNAIVTAKKPVLGTYGRIYLQPEQFSLSGV